MLEILYSYLYSDLKVSIYEAEMVCNSMIEIDFILTDYFAYLPL